MRSPTATYPGWLGSIDSEDRYQTRGKFSKAKFEADCLTRYAQKTFTFPTVCGDFAFCQFPTEQYWAKRFEPVSRGFLFGLKVPEDITVSTWPKHGRYGPRAGKENEHFLDARSFEWCFAKRLEPHVGHGNRRMRGSSDVLLVEGRGHQAIRAVADV